MLFFIGFLVTLAAVHTHSTQCKHLEQACQPFSSPIHLSPFIFPLVFIPCPLSFSSFGDIPFSTHVYLSKSHPSFFLVLYSSSCLLLPFPSVFISSRFYLPFRTFHSFSFLPYPFLGILSSFIPCHLHLLWSYSSSNSFPPVSLHPLPCVISSFLPLFSSYSFILHLTSFQFFHSSLYPHFHSYISLISSFLLFFHFFCSFIIPYRYFLYCSFLSSPVSFLCLLSLISGSSWFHIPTFSSFLQLSLFLPFPSFPHGSSNHHPWLPSLTNRLKKCKNFYFYLPHFFFVCSFSSFFLSFFVEFYSFDSPPSKSQR